MLKKMMLGACVAIAAVSCSNNGGNNMPAVSEPKTFADSVAMYIGLCDAYEMNLATSKLPDSVQSKLDKEKFLLGVKTILLADTSASFRQGMDVALNYVQNMNMAKAAGVDFNNEMFLAYFAQEFLSQNSDSVVAAENKAKYEVLAARLGEIVNAYQIEQQAKAQVELGKMFETNVAAGKAFIDSIKAADATVKTTKSGIAYKVMTQGKGRVAKAGQTANIIITGSLINGARFISSEGNVVPMPINEAFCEGLKEALTTFPIGTRVMLYIPQELAFGAQGYQGIEPGTTLVFDLEIVE